VHTDHWQILTVHAGSISARFALGRFEVPEQAVMLSAPGMGCRIDPAPGTVITDALFSAIPATGRSVPWAMLDLPIVVPGMARESFLALSKEMGARRWKDSRKALHARFELDQALLAFVEKGFESGRITGCRPRPAWLRDAVQAVNGKLSDPTFQVKHFAQLAGCSVDHLNRTIQTFYGCSSSTFLRRLRIERAAHLLQHDPAVRTEEVADLCGFSSARHLRDQWKCETGQGLRSFRSP